MKKGDMFNNAHLKVTKVKKSNGQTQLTIKPIKFWLSIKPIGDCLYSRRQGHMGKRVFGYSVCLRLFGYDII